MDHGVQPTIDLRFQPYLHSNDLPRRKVLEEAARLKVQWLTDLQTLDKEIQTLQQKRDVMKNRLWAFDCILAPIRRLSDDVLVEIFCHCIPTTRNARPFVSEAPLLLTLVCKKWRTIAMSTPRLWTTLHIPVVFYYSSRVRWSHRRSIPELDTSDCAHLAQSTLSELNSCRNAGLDQWLRRSGHLPLSLSLYSPMHGFLPENHDPAVNFRQATLDLIARSADRISRLEVEIPAYILHELGMAITEYFDFKCLPRLQQLRISSDPGTDLPNSLNGDVETSNLTAETFKIFVGAKSLRELSSRLGGFGSPRDISDSLPHTSTNITTLLLHEPISVSAAWYALSLLHRLERCHFSVDDVWRAWSLPDPHDPIVRESIVLPALNTLSVNGILLDIQSLCEILEVSSLSILQLHILPGSNVGRPPLPSNTSGNTATNDIFLPYPPDSTQQLCAFLALCTSLRSLTLIPFFLQAAELQSILRALPQVEHLALNSPQTARVGSQLHYHVPPYLGLLKYSLDPLLRQRRVLLVASSNDELYTRLETPLLPCLQSFEWHQSYEKVIPYDHFINFINNRLFQEPTRISAGETVTASSVSGLENPPNSQQAPTKSLKSIKIRVPDFDVDSIKSKIIQHAENEGLTRGGDFQLDVGICPSVAPVISNGPRYVIPPGFTRPKPVDISEDGLFIDHDVTWPWVEF